MKAIFNSLKTLVTYVLLTSIIITISCDNEGESKSEKPEASFISSIGVTETDYFLVEFEDSSTGGEAVAWAWDFGVEGIDTDVSEEQNPTYSFPEEDATYTVTLSVTTADGLTDMFESVIVIAVIGPEVEDPLASFTYSIGETTSDYFTVEFTDTSTGGMAVSWAWDFGVESIDTDVSEEQSPIFDFPKTNATYTVNLTVTNAMGVTSTLTSNIEINVLQFTTLEELKATVDWNYRVLAHENLYGRKLTLALMVRSDMVSIGDPNTSSRRTACDEMNLGFDNGLADVFWEKGYELIDSVNTVINDGGKDIDGATEAELNEVIAEARFLRALMQYHFVRLFGSIPLTLTAPIGTEDTFVVVESSVSEIYESIITDLIYAKTWLPDLPATRTLAGKGSAASILASVYMTTESWQEAYSEAKYVIDNSGTFGYALEADFADLFGAITTSNEVIFEVENIGGDGTTNPSELGGLNAATDYLAPLTGPRVDERFAEGEGWSVLVPTLAVHDTWPDEYRKSVSLDTVMTYLGDQNYFYTEWANASSQNVNNAYIAKYYRATGQSGSVSGTSLRDSETNYFVIRYAEVLLIAAEAAAEIGIISDALTYTNQVRARSGNEALVSLNPQDVIEERRLELAFEFKRWYDIIRRGLISDAFSESGLETQSWTTKDYLFPKPQSAINDYPNLAQNPGY